LEARIEAIERDDLAAGAALDDAALVEDEDAVGVPDGGEMVGDDKGGSALEEVAEAFKDQALGFFVEAGTGLVEDHDAGIADHCPGESEALTLAAGERHAGLARRAAAMIWVFSQRTGARAAISRGINYAVGSGEEETGCGRS